VDKKGKQSTYIVSKTLQIQSLDQQGRMRGLLSNAGQFWKIAR